MTLTVNPFAIDKTRLSSLTPLEATELFRDLLWCEARRGGLSPHQVQISTDISTPDGGVDAHVAAPITGSILCKGKTHVQLKSGKGFRPWIRSDAMKELFGEGRPDKATLAPAVRNCMRRNGHYVLVTYGHDLTPQRVETADSLLKLALRKAGFPKARVSVLGQTQLISLIEAFPSIVYRLQGLSDRFFLDYSTWRQQDLMQPAAKLGAAQNEFIGKIRAALDGDQIQHIRVIGEPGIGKTRLVLEAISTAAHTPLTLYAPLGEDFQRSQLLLDFTRAGSHLSGIVVVDDCPERERASIWATFKGKSGVRLITLDHGPERSHDAAMLVLQCPPLSSKEIGEILASYIDSPGSLSRWADMCEGSPRVAHAVGENLQRNPGDILKPPASVPLWDRYIAGYRPLDGPFSRQAMVLMRHLALFDKFGFEAPVEEEARYIAELVAAADPSITWAVFQDHVQQLRGRRILQGKRTLVIVPRLLHVHLWLEYWNAHGRGFDFPALFEAMPGNLRNWFLRLFSFAHANPVSLSIVRTILAPSGPFDNKDLLRSEAGATFLSSLAEADPAGVVALLQRTVARWPDAELKAWTLERQRIVWALERVAVWSEHFDAAVAVLLRLALNENAKNTNNATGTLRGLFVVGFGWAPTQAPPAQRFSILKRLIVSSAPEERAFALSLFTAWLSTYGGIRILGPEHQGLRPTIEFWRPKTYGELFDAWRQAWRELYSATRKWPVSERRLANDTLIETGAGLLQNLNVADEVLDTWSTLAEDDATDRATLVQAVIRGTRATGAKEKIVKRLRELDEKLTGANLWGRIERFGLFSNWEEDYHRGCRADGAMARRIVSLAKELASGSEFAKHLPRLVASQGHRLHLLGYEVSRRLGADTLTDLISAQRAALPQLRTQFLAGYLMFIKECDASRWDTEVLKLFRDDVMRPVALQMIGGCGYSPATLRELLALIAQGKAEPACLKSLPWQADRCGIGGELVAEAVDCLAGQGSLGARATAIALVDMYFCQKERPRPFVDDRHVEQLLLLPVDIDARHDDGFGFHWGAVAAEYCRRFPEREVHVFKELLAQMQRVGPLLQDDRTKVTLEIVSKRAEEVWSIVAEVLEADHEDRNLRYWLGGWSGFGEDRQRGVISLFDPQKVMAWALADRRRLRILFECLPKTLSDPDGALTRLYIEQILEDDSAFDSLIQHFRFSDGWSGRESDHLRSKRDRARTWFTANNSPKVLGWIQHYIRFLDSEIEHAEIYEERRGY